MNRIARYLSSTITKGDTLPIVFLRSVAISVFVGLFLTVFKPFGLNTLRIPHHNWFIFSYALPCLFALAVLESLRLALTRLSLLNKPWKVWHQLLFIALAILFISASNHAYSCLIFGQKPCAEAFLEMLVQTTAVGVFPALAIVFTTGMVNFALNESAAGGINAEVSSGPATLPSPDADAEVVIAGLTGESARFLAGEIRYVKAEGNYVEVVTMQGGVKRSTLLRATLHEAEAALAAKAPGILRCHRSYLVNSAAVRHAEGSSQGLALTLDLPGVEIPVSRSFVGAFRTRRS